MRKIDPNTGQRYKEGLSFAERMKLMKGEKSCQGIIMRRCSTHFEKVIKKKKSAEKMWKALKGKFRNKRPQFIGHSYMYL
jgi:hypothetical protein